MHMLHMCMFMCMCMHMHMSIVPKGRGTVDSRPRSAADGTGPTADQGSLPAHRPRNKIHHSPLSLSVSHSPLVGLTCRRCRLAVGVVSSRWALEPYELRVALPGGRLKTEKECGS